MPLLKTIGTKNDSRALVVYIWYMIIYVCLIDKNSFGMPLHAVQLQDRAQAVH